jgi:superfamily II DNA or RNA helicase
VITRNAQKLWAPREAAALAPSLRYELTVHDTLSEHHGTYAPSWGTHPLLELRPRLPGERAILDKDRLESIRLPTRDQKALRRCQPVPSGNKGFYATGDGAATVIELLRGADLHLTDGRPVRFARAPALLRVVRTKLPRHRVGARSTYAPHPYHGRHWGRASDVAPTGRALDEVACLEARWFTRDGALDLPSADVILFVGLSAWLWVPATATMYPIPESLSPDAAFRLFVTPSVEVAEGHAPTLFRALRAGLTGTAVELPALPELGLAEAETPALRVRLAGDPLHVTLTLEAAYGAGAVALAPGATDEDPAATRDLPTEAAALARVTALGLPWSSADRAWVADDHDAARLWSEGVASLRADGDPPLELLIPHALARASKRRPLVPGVRVKLVGGWFETDVDVVADDVPVDLARLRAALSDGRRWVALDDGSLAEITEEVAELLSDGDEALDAGGHARLAVHQVGRVERWLHLAGERAQSDAGTVRVRERIRVFEASLAELPTGLTATLRPYQHAGFSWLRMLEDLGLGGILADDMGLGKTLTALCLILSARERRGPAPSLVVCPTSVLGNWAREAARFAPSLRVRVLHGGDRDLTPETLAAHDLLVTSYGLLRRDEAALAMTPLRALIFDEAQVIKNASAATAKAARGLRAELRLALSGTPVENRLDELWSLMDVVNPGLLGARSAFARRFATPIALDPKGGAARRLRALVRPFVLRRTKRAVLSELPAKEEIDVPCVLPPAQRALYDATAKLARESLGAQAGGQRELAVFTALLRLRQVACDPRLMPGAPAAPSAKREAFLRLVRDLVAEGRRALVFSQFVELLTLWRADLDREGIAYEYLDGSTRDRDGAVARFQGGDAPLFLISLKAGGAGLNLTAADTVVHCDPWWNPAVEDQATDRAHRIGQTRRVTVLRLVARGTVEDRIEALKARKRTLAEAAVGETEDGALKGLSEAEVAALLGDASGDDVDDEEAGDVMEAVAEAVPVTAALAKPAAEDVARLREAMKRWLAEGDRKQKDLAKHIGIGSWTVGAVLRGAEAELTAEEVTRALSELTAPVVAAKKKAAPKKRAR